MHGVQLCRTLYMYIPIFHCHYNKEHECAVYEGDLRVYIYSKSFACPTLTKRKQLLKIIFLVNEQNVSVMYLDINAISLCPELRNLSAG